MFREAESVRLVTGAQTLEPELGNASAGSRDSPSTAASGDALQLI
jgi:hypothetical protein